MKVALVHDTLTEYGGSERVLQLLLKIYPQAHVYTAYIDKKLINRHFPSLTDYNLHISFLQKLRLSQYGYLFQFLAPIIWNTFDFEEYDIVISNSAFFMSNLLYVKHPIHIQYIQTPPKNIFNLIPQNSFQKMSLIKPLLSHLYLEKLRNSSHIIVNSVHSQQLLQKISNISSTIIYPPIRIPNKIKRLPGQYFLIVSRLTPEKRIDVAIRACTQLGTKLKIVGITTDSEYEGYLKSLAGSSIEFLGFRSDKEIDVLFTKAKGFLFTPDAEDFGIAPLEAIAHGVPVISYYGGGAKETILENITGVFYTSETTDSLAKVIKEYNPDAYDYPTMKKTVNKYSEKRFSNELKTYVNVIYNKKIHENLK